MTSKEKMTMTAAEPKTVQPGKPFDNGKRNRKRYGTLAVLAVLCWYFCLHTTPLQISTLTTGITEPFKPDGTLDYFGAYEKQRAYKFSPPEENGMRDVIAALGPAVLEQAALIAEYTWDEIVSGKPQQDRGGSYNWYEQYYKPLCTAMYIDPEAEPKYLKSPAWESVIQKLHKGDKEWNDEKQKELREKLATAPWKSADQPETAAWLKERSPVLDLVSKTVRKPHYVEWQRREDWMCWILLPAAQAQRTFARELRIRIMERVGRGDIDGAFDDAMSILHLAKHLKRAEFCVTKLVGLSCDDLAVESVKVILEQGKPSAEQLAKFAAGLESLPGHWCLEVFDAVFESVVEYECLYRLSQASGWQGIMQMREFAKFCDERNGFVDFRMFIFALPIDMNIAGKRMHDYIGEYWRELRVCSSPAALLAASKKYSEKVEKMTGDFEKNRSQWLLLPLVSYRSRLAGDLAANLLIPALDSVNNTIVRSGTRLDLMRTAVALERYKTDSGKYPDNLDALVPQYLDEVPPDGFTGRKTITYKPAAGDKSAADKFILYSFGANGVDDNGIAGTPKNPKDRNHGDTVW
ncbi:MAG: hypothetical protein LBH00_00680 [Planctomycetaceae bacterium]|nr:hypothetical protein [Planctomycetaceae bacterium]